MEQISQGDIADTTGRSKWAISYAIDGDLKFISHHDTLRLFRRAFARAELPLQYSQGFNPHPRMTIPLPRPVGIASDDEVVVVELSRAIDANEALPRLQACVPRGMTIHEIRGLSNGERLVPDSVRYRFSIEGDTPEDLAVRAERITAAAELQVTREDHKGGKASNLNVRPFLIGVYPADDSIEFVLRVTGTGSARPSEIVGLLGFESRNINHRIRRLEVQWQ
ncbi:MAG: DUF2344 domain-containing protein [Planctomycetes bacterium]|nr:DUF2344 domain-containing protein [Planctomycetota bacterium]MBI3835218.1 DUF2344 domain-containing protein [Planctomycetota bacterium]